MESSTGQHGDNHGESAADNVVQPEPQLPPQSPPQSQPAIPPPQAPQVKPPQPPLPLNPAPPPLDVFRRVEDAGPTLQRRWKGQVEYQGTCYAPAGFWLRCVAFLIDLLLLSLLHTILVEIARVPKPDLGALLSAMAVLFDELMASGFPSEQTFALLDELRRPAIFSGWLRVAMCAIYFTLFHGLLGQSLGKLCVGIRVLRKDGKPLSLGWAALRYLGYFLTARLLYTAWIVPFDVERRTLYDMALGTNVYREISPRQ